MKQVLVKWHDAKSCPNCYTEEEIAKLKMAVFQSLGYLISRDKIVVKIASEHNGEGEYRDITLIPTGSIVSIEDLMPSPTM